MEKNISTKPRYQRATKEKRLLHKNSEFAKIAEEIVASPGYEIIRHIDHHDASIADHAVAVALHSFNIACLCGLNQRLGDLTRGALLHDYFHYNWHVTRSSSGKLHGFHHPREALENAEIEYGPLSKVERDIILRHMWPLTPIPPRYPESLIVCIIDKAVAIRESWIAIRTGKGLGVL